MLGAARAVLACAVLVTCGFVVGCTDSSADSIELVDGVEVPVDAIDNSFRPEQITVAPGTEVVWTNRGRSDHDILPVEGDAFGVEAAQFGPDATYRYRFTEPGEYAYYCSLHGTKTRGMVGKVVVGDG
jgi:plastocyanin